MSDSGPLAASTVRYAMWHRIWPEQSPPFWPALRSDWPAPLQHLTVAARSRVCVLFLALATDGRRKNGCQAGAPKWPPDQRSHGDPISQSDEESHSSNRQHHYVLATDVLRGTFLRSLHVWYEAATCANCALRLTTSLGINIKSLKPLEDADGQSKEVEMLVNWLENGVFDALGKKYVSVENA